MKPEKLPDILNRNDLLINTGPEYDLEPVGNMVVLEKIEQSDLTAGGLHIPETANSTKMVLFKVLKVGPGQPTISGAFIPCGVSPGDLVVIVKDRGGIFAMAGVKAILAEATAIIAIARPKVRLDS